MDLSYSYNHLGDSAQVLQEIAAGTHPYCQVTPSFFLLSIRVSIVAEVLTLVQTID